jgi:phosphohistidine phosphatase
MELLIVRHAIAYERNARRWPDDRERPLSPRGRLRGREAAAGLRLLTERPLQLLTSPLLRARETAALLTQVARWPRAVVCPQLAPGTDPQLLIALLGRLRGARVAMVGHEPDLSRLLAACLRGGADAAAFGLKKMGVARVDFRGTPQRGRGELAWLLPPKALRAARDNAPR